MKPGTDRILARAARSISAATKALENGDADMAAARAYSAMVAAAKALLNEKGLRLTTHATICAAFEKHAPIAGVPAEQTALLRGAHNRRQRSVFEDLSPSFDDMREMVDRAIEFVAAVRGSVRP